MKLAFLVSLTSVAAVLAETVQTGDVFQGYPVIESLDVTDVPSNSISRFWLWAAEGQGGIPYYVPIIVARGSNDSIDSGRRLSLSASIHGDELNGIPVVHRAFNRLREVVESGEFNGTVIGIPQLNSNGNLHSQRGFFAATGNFGVFTDLNRLLPGLSIEEGGAITDAYVNNIWNKIWGNTSNVDIAVDLHCLSSGADGPLWAYADFRLDGVQRLAELAQPDIIKIDPGEPGSVETTWVDNSIPAITLEIGPANVWNETLISRSEDFIFRLMEDLQMLPNSSTVDVDLSNTFKGTNFSSVVATKSGWAQMSVGVLSDVEEGQQVGVIYNTWGDVVENLTSLVSGRVLEVRTDPAVEQGNSVLNIVYNATSSG